LKTGRSSKLKFNVEMRTIFLAQGIERHESDFELEVRKEESEKATFDFLKRGIEKSGLLKKPEDLNISKKDGQLEFLNRKQKVKYIIKIINSKDKFKNALQTPGVHVVYNGHSRHGRGACFDIYPADKAADQKGDQWENGREIFWWGVKEKDNGIFRMGYRYVLIKISDLFDHDYHFTPVRAEYKIPKPGSENRKSNFHPQARSRLRLISLPDELKPKVISGYESETNQYWGRKGMILVHAGWKSTIAKTHDLGATELKCKVFCHFGCSSRLHFSAIIRSPKYNNWQEASPQNRFTYLTTAPSDELDSFYWLLYLLTYSKRNDFENWWVSLEWARHRANQRLISEGIKYKIWCPLMYQLTPKQLKKKELIMKKRYGSK